MTISSKNHPEKTPSRVLNRILNYFCDLAVSDAFFSGSCTRFQALCAKIFFLVEISLHVGFRIRLPVYYSFYYFVSVEENCKF